MSAYFRKRCSFLLFLVLFLAPILCFCQSNVRVLAGEGGMFKIIAVSQNGTSYADQSAITNLPWAAEDSNMLSIGFRFTNDYGFSVTKVCVTPSVGSISSRQRITAIGTIPDSGTDSGLTLTTSTDGDGNITACADGLSIAEGEYADIYFPDVEIGNSYISDENISWTTTFDEYETDAGASTVTGVVDSTGTMTQTIKAPVLTSVSPGFAYANTSSSQTYRITNPTVYVATVYRIVFKFDSMTDDSNFDFVSSPTSLISHVADGTAPTGWSLVLSGPLLTANCRLVYFQSDSNTMLANGSINFVINFTVGNAYKNTSNMRWTYFRASDGVDIAGYSTSTTWTQYGLEITGITPAQVTKGIKTNLSVVVKNHLTSSAGAKVTLTSTSGTLGSSDPSSATIAAGSTSTFVFPFTDSNTETVNLSAIASYDNSGTWVDGASNTYTLAISSVTGTTPRSGFEKIALFSTLSMIQKFEFALILIIFFALCYVIFSYYRRKSRNTES